MNKKRIDSKTFILFLLFFLLAINYRYVVSKYFYYEGYQQYFSMPKFIIICTFTFILIILYMFIKDDFYKIVYSIYLVLVYFGQAIFYIFNQANFILVVYMAIPLIALFIQQKLDRKRTIKDIKLKLSDKFTWYVFIVLSIIVVIPFFKNYNLINFTNLLLQDIYITRSMQSGQLPGIFGYLFSPISRVILPFLFIYSIENKKKIIAILSLVLLLMMFLLNGALKSIFFSLLACIFFYKGNYSNKEKRFLYTMALGVGISIIEPLISKTFVIADYLRRIIFLPANLFEVYYVFFQEPTLFLHSRISKLLGINKYTEHIPHIIGEYALGKKGLSANVGIFAEGFISFGALGVILASIIFSYIIKYFNNRRLSPVYFGLLFSYLYVINTSFIETLFVTHGLLFYMIFAFFIIPKDKDLNKQITIVD